MIPVPVFPQEMEHPNLRSFMRHFYRVVKAKVERGDTWNDRILLIQIERKVLQVFVPESLDNDELTDFIEVIAGDDRIVRCLYIAPIRSGFQFVGDDPTEGLLVGTCGPKATKLKINKPISSNALMPVRYRRIS